MHRSAPHTNRPTTGIHQRATDINHSAPDIRRNATDIRQPTPEMHRATMDINRPATHMHRRAKDMYRPPIDVSCRTTHANYFTMNNFHFGRLIRPPTVNLKAGTADVRRVVTSGHDRVTSLQRRLVKIERDAAASAGDEPGFLVTHDVSWFTSCAFA